MLENLDGQLVEYWRKRRGLTQEELAEKVSEFLPAEKRPLSRNAIAQWEASRNGITEPNRRALVAALGLSMTEFYRAESKLDETAA